MKCAGCPREFAPSNQWQLYHSEACSNAARQRRFRKRALERRVKAVAARTKPRTLTFENEHQRRAADKWPCRCPRPMWGLVDGERRCLHCGRRPA